jgi:adenosine deaminase
MRVIFTALTLGLMVQFSAFENAYADEKAAARYLETVKGERAKLRQFMQTFPKGGDLHNHLTGGVYAETMLDWAAEDGLCVELTTPALGMDESGKCTDEGWAKASDILLNANERRRIINALSVRSYHPELGWSGHDQFFVTFERMRVKPSRLADILVAVSERAASQNIQYLELLQTPVLGELIGMLSHVELTGDVAKDYKILMDGPFGKAIPRLLDGARKARQQAFRNRHEKQNCDGIDPSLGCDVEIRFLHQVVREFSPAVVFAQIILGWELMADEDGSRGLNLVAPEDGYLALRDYTYHMQMIDYLYQTAGARNITLHAGELTLGLVRPKQLKFHIREAIEIGHAKRIGHGIAISYEHESAQLLKKMRDERILVEINLTSNDVILGIKGADHPWSLYREAGVPTALSTDDEGVSRIDLTYEYMRAVSEHDMTYQDLKELSRNSIVYSFLEDVKKQEILQRLEAKFAEFEDRF